MGSETCQTSRSRVVDGHWDFIEQVAGDTSLKRTAITV